MVDLFAAHLLGRHVAHGAENDSGHRGGDGRSRRLPCHRADLGCLGEAEVENLDDSIPRQEDVFGLEVAMHHSPLVRRGEPLRDLKRVLERFAHRKVGGVQPLPQRLALQQLHHRIRDSPLLANVVNREDVRVRQGRDRLRFPFESGKRIGVLRQPVGKDFDRDVAGEARVPSAVHLSHSSGAQGREDFVWSEPATAFDHRPPIRIPLPVRIAPSLSADALGGSPPCAGSIVTAAVDPPDFSRAPPAGGALRQEEQRFYDGPPMRRIRWGVRAPGDSRAKRPGPVLP